jgi:hypothetical protein
VLISCEDANILRPPLPQNAATCAAASRIW